MIASYMEDGVLASVGLEQRNVDTAFCRAHGGAQVLLRFAKSMVIVTEPQDAAWSLSRSHRLSASFAGDCWLAATSLKQECLRTLQVSLHW